MPAEKMFTTTIAVEGRVDESLARALGTTVGKLKEFQLQFNGMMRMSDKMQLKANNFLPPAELAKAQRGLATFQSKMAGMMSGTKSMMTTAMGTGLGFLLAEGFNFAISQAEKLKDAVVDAVNKAADFETQKLELGIDVGFSQKQIQEYVGYLYKASANVPVTVPTALEATRLISSSISISDPIKKEEQIKKTFEMLENIAAATTPSGGNPVEAFNEHLKGMTESFTKMQKAGVVLERNIYPLEAGGVNVRPAMIETLEKMKESGVDIDPKNFDLLSRSVQDKLLGDLAKNVKKRAVPSSVLEEIMFAMVQPGGKYYGAAEKSGHTTGGVLGSSADVMQFFERGLGDAINGPLKHLLEQLNATFADHIPQLTKYFDDLSASWSKNLDPIIDKLLKGDWGLTADAFNLLMNALGKDFIKAEPALEKIADTIPKLVTGFELLATITAKLVGVFERLGWINFPLKLGLMFRGLSLSFGDSATRGRWHRYKPASGHGR